MILAVFALIAGGLGALARYGLAAVVQRRTGSARPLGTATVNILGAALLGLVVGLAAAGRVSHEVTYVVGAGFLGSFTTFSTWMVDSVHLRLREGVVAALANLAGMSTAGLVGAAIGSAIGSM
jgi:fluoride exporter